MTLFQRDADRMLTLFHHPFCPHSRFVRLAVEELGLASRLVEERVWDRREEFLILNPAGTTPVLVEEGMPPVPGAAIIAEYTGLGDDVAAADLVITGEGRFDDQSLHGKVVSALAAGARSRQIPVLVLAGQVTLEESALQAAGIGSAFSVTDHAGSVQRAIEDAANQLTGLASVVAASFG